MFLFLSSLLTSQPLKLFHPSSPLSFLAILHCLPPPQPVSPRCFLHLAVLRYPPSCPGRVPGARVSAAWRRLLGQAAAAGATVRAVQSSQLAAARQRSGLHCVRHQVHGAGQPRGLLGRLPERSSFGGPKGGFHHGLAEDGCRLRGCPPSDQRGPRRLRGGPEAAESQQIYVRQSWWAQRDSLDFEPK